MNTATHQAKERGFAHSTAKLEAILEAASQFRPEALDLLQDQAALYVGMGPTARTFFECGECVLNGVDICHKAMTDESLTLNERKLEVRRIVLTDLAYLAKTLLEMCDRKEFPTSHNRIRVLQDTAENECF